MKKIKCLLFIFVYVVIVLFSSGNRYSDSYDNNFENLFSFPNSLLEIEEEAFAGTAARTIVFQNGLLKIGNYAFADARNLVNVFIPSSTEDIGELVFPRNKSLTIFGVKGSYAETWANENQLPFIEENIWSCGKDNERAIKDYWISIGSFLAIGFPRKRKLYGRMKENAISLRPQDRPELYPIDYRFP